MLYKLEKEKTFTVSRVYIIQSTFYDVHLSMIRKEIQLAKKRNFSDEFFQITHVLSFYVTILTLSNQKVILVIANKAKYADPERNV